MFETTSRIDVPRLTTPISNTLSIRLANLLTLEHLGSWIGFSGGEHACSKIPRQHDAPTLNDQGLLSPSGTPLLSDWNNSRAW